MRTTPCAGDILKPGNFVTTSGARLATGRQIGEPRLCGSARHPNDAPRGMTRRTEQVPARLLALVALVLAEVAMACMACMAC